MSETIILKKTTRVRRKPKTIMSESVGPSTESVGPSTESVGPSIKQCELSEFIKQMTIEPTTERMESNRFPANDIELPPGGTVELFHAFCVARDILGTSYRPLECNLSIGKIRLN